MSILIGIHIEQTLKSNAEIAALLEGRVYPVAIPQGTPKYPFLVYLVTSINPNYTKDGKNEDDVNVIMQICAKTHSQTITIANKVRYALEGITAEYQTEGFRINTCEMMNYSEDYNDDLPAWTSTIEMRFTTNDY